MATASALTRLSRDVPAAAARRSRAGSPLALGVDHVQRDQVLARAAARLVRHLSPRRLPVAAHDGLPGVRTCASAVKASRFSVRGASTPRLVFTTSPADW